MTVPSALRHSQCQQCADLRRLLSKSIGSYLKLLKTEDMIEEADTDKNTELIDLDAQEYARLMKAYEDFRAHRFAHSDGEADTLLRANSPSDREDRAGTLRLPSLLMPASQN